MSDLETKVIAHHVGGRGFGVAFNAPNEFKSDIVHVLYEADRTCVDEMIGDVDNAQSKMLGERHVFPYCLGRMKSSGKLNITANTYASSMLTPNPEFFKNHYCEIQIGPAVYDVTYDDMLQVVEQVDVEVQTLDELFANHQLPGNLSPDILSLDTQGLEVDIIRGAERVIAGDVLAIVTEVEIVSMYQSQPLLGDMLKLMSEYGFHYAGFTNIHEVSQYRAPIGLRGKAFPGFGDALFLRNVEALRGIGLSASALFLKAIKLAFVSCVFGHVEYTLKTLQFASALISQVPPDLLAELETRTYFKFLKEIETAARHVEQVYPPILGIPSSARRTDVAYPVPSWYDAHHDEAMANCYKRMSASPSSASPVRHATWVERLGAHFRYFMLVESMDSQVRIRHLLVTRPHKAIAKMMFYTANYLRYRLPALSAILSSLLAQPMPSPSPETSPSRAEEGFSAFESILIHYGLSSVAEVVRLKRIAAERFVRSFDPSWR